MSTLRERTLEMIERLPEEKVIYIFNILKDIETPLLAEHRNGYSEYQPQGKAAELAALFGSIDDDTFQRPSPLSFSLDAERAVL